MKETNRLRELIFIKPQSLEEAEENWKEAQTILQPQTQDIKKKAKEMKSPDALAISKRLRKELGEGRPITEAMVLGACMGFDYALSDILEEIK